jgi:class 3 adenylate cyclase/tetratricopeptide (TPR) repeat protein
VAEQRKVVTILFADVVGSTAMAEQSDPEVVRATMARYFGRIVEISQSYGGTVEKFAGDAAMVVFGVPVVHDDDAERAVRAALEIRDGASELQVRVGVNTGEAVTAAREDRQFMVSGDSVNVAARLQQGAEPGEVVVGPLTEQLTRKVIEYESHEPVTARGKATPLVAFRAVNARTHVPEQARGVAGLHAVLVGRDRELSLLLDTFARTAADRKAHLFTLVGSAGVGKSRLVTEALSALTSSGARVVRGRCLPYGRGITYWPLIEILRDDTGITLADERDVAVQKLDRWLGELLHDDPQRPAIRARLSVMLGFEAPESVMPDTPAERVDRELGWGMRRYLEAVAKAAPLILVVDDLQWAEPPVVTLIEQLVERVAEAPMLVISIARPEFLEKHRDWGAGKPNSTTITLDPLSPQDTGTLISRLLEIEALPAELRDQIIERSAGTPLFCEEFIQMLIDEGRLVHEGSSWRATGPIEQIRVPQSISAVLAARLDGLGERERNVIQAASVVGQRFQLRQLEELAGGSDVEETVESLRRKGLVIGGDGADDDLAFRHLLIRDAAYASLPKSERAALHDRFGTALEQQAGDPQQLTEILAHHAEQAFTLSKELGLSGDVFLNRGRRALDWSLAMADRSRTRYEVQTLESALKIVRSIAAVLPDARRPEAGARLRLLEAQLMVMKADYTEGAKAAAEAATLADDAGLLPLVAAARVAEAWIWNWSGEGSLEDFERVVMRAIEATRRAGDVSGEIEARHIGSSIPYATGRLNEFAEINERLVEKAKSIGDSARAATILLRLANALTMLGNQAAADRHVSEAEALAASDGLRDVAQDALRLRGHKRRFAGEVGAAEAIYRQWLAAAKDAGSVQQQVGALRWLGNALMDQHRWGDAATALDEALGLSESSGERWHRSELFGLRARAALGLGDLELADQLIARAAELFRDEDITAISEAHEQLGLIRTAQGRYLEAETAFRRSVEVLADSEYHSLKTSPILALAKFLASRGRVDEAVPLLEERARWVHERNFHLWDPQIDEIRNLTATARNT